MNLITLDFETFYSQDYSLSKMTTEAYVRDPRFEVILVGVKVNDEAPVWFTGTHEEIKTRLEALQLERNALLAHNTAFDGLILSHHFGIVPAFLLDTMSMAKPRHAADIGVSLKALSDKYTIGIKGDAVIAAKGKRRADFTPAELEEYARYCMQDVQLTHMLLGILQRGFPRSELAAIDCLLRMFVSPVLVLDTDVLQAHLTKLAADREAILRTVEKIGSAATLRSNPQFAELLRELGVEPPTKISPTTGKETYAFSKKDVAFTDLLEHHDPRVQAVVAARLGVRSTLEETRTKSFLEIAARGTLPVPIGYYNAHTGRAGGWDGINLQNLPRDGALRRAIRAPEGHVLVACDSAAIEARITAWLAGQDDLVEDFRRRVDVYSKFASDVFGRPIDRKREEVDPATGAKYFPDKNEGFVGKTCILGLGFGMAGAKFQHTLLTGKPSIRYDMDECERIVRLYRGKYQAIPRLWKAAERLLDALLAGTTAAIGPGGLIVAKDGAIHLPNGMQLRYQKLTRHARGYFYAANKRELVEYVKQNLSGTLDPEQFTNIYSGKVVENIVQALARIVVFDQMLEIARRFRVVMTVHDEVVVCVPRAMGGVAKQFMVEVMGRPPAWAPSLPVACEAHIGVNYGEAK